MAETSVMENAMMTLGMNSPPSRFIGVGVAVSGLMWFVKPGYFFDPTTKQPNPDAVIPWWSVGVACGALAALFL